MNTDATAMSFTPFNAQEMQDFMQFKMFQKMIAAQNSANVGAAATAVQADGAAAKVVKTRKPRGSGVSRPNPKPRGSKASGKSATLVQATGATPMAVEVAGVVVEAPGATPTAVEADGGAAKVTKTRKPRKASRTKKMVLKGLLGDLCRKDGGQVYFKLIQSILDDKNTSEKKMELIFSLSPKMFNPRSAVGAMVRDALKLPQPVRKPRKGSSVEAVSTFDTESESILSTPVATGSTLVTPVAAESTLVTPVAAESTLVTPVVAEELQAAHLSYILCSSEKDSDAEDDKEKDSDAEDDKEKDSDAEDDKEEDSDAEDDKEEDSDEEDDEEEDSDEEDAA
jgi:hypothetical protein